MKCFRSSIVALAIAAGFVPARAEVSAQEAAQLKTTLNPLGGERAGNADGSIPEWTGVFDRIPPGWKAGDRRTDPFAADKPLYSVTAANLDAHAAKLSDGTKAMLQKYPQSFRLDVYPTRRTAGAPQWVYDGTLKNATRAKLVPTSSGPAVVEAVAGIPFPIPKKAEEVMWNIGLNWKGVTKQTEQQSFQITSDGRPILVSQNRIANQWPYYDPKSTPEDASKTLIRVRFETTGPALRAGEAVVGSIGLSPEDDKTYVYLPGQRRVRKLPRACCDTPTPATAGLATFDETAVFAGRLDQFDWKIVGKREVLVPYNTNRLLVPAKATDVIGAKHLNPDFVRWELHRVWVVESTLAEGKRHVVKRSRYYIDEDSWAPLLGERYDGNGRLWKSLWQMLYAVPDLPGVYSQTWGFNDLVSDVWFVSGLMNESKVQMQEVARLPDAFFNPDAVASQGVR